MQKKEIVTEHDLLKVLDFMNTTGIRYWLDGGWGVDVLAGKQTREHRDVDINYDAQCTEQLLQLLKDKGYEMATDWGVVRMELHHPQHGYLDIHPFVLNDDGTAKQSNLEGGWYEFEADFFGMAVFKGRSIPCISAKGQKIFHTGYELRDIDVHDLKIINDLNHEGCSMLLRKALKEDIIKLTEISKNAFHTDVNMGGKENDGPPSYDSIKWHEEMLLQDHLFTYLEKDEIVGGAVLFQNGTNLYVGRIFISPDFFKQGYGRKLMQDVEHCFQDVKTVHLDTPVWNIRTNNFYHKCGYVETKRDDESVYYEKHVNIKE